MIYASDMTMKMKKEAFLSCKSNKAKFIVHLASEFSYKHIIVIEAPEDADVVIVQTAIETAKTFKTVVVADDTDILVLLLCHTTSDCSHIYFSPECKQGLPNTAGTIREMQQDLCPEVCSLLPFCHALLGCDTTGHVYDIGKANH